MSSSTALSTRQESAGASAEAGHKNNQKDGTLQLHPRSIAAVSFIKVERLSATFVELKDWGAGTRVGKTNP